MFLLPSTKTSKMDISGFERPAVEPPELPESVLVRRSTAADAARLRTLARLDDRRLPEGPFIVAEIAGEVTAATSLSAGVTVADPFRRTADVVDILRLRSAQLAERKPARAARESRDVLKPIVA